MGRMFERNKFQLPLGTKCLNEHSESNVPEAINRKWIGKSAKLSQLYFPNKFTQKFARQYKMEQDGEQHLSPLK